MQLQGLPRLQCAQSPFGSAVTGVRNRRRIGDTKQQFASLILRRCVVTKQGFNRIARKTPPFRAGMDSVLSLTGCLLLLDVLPDNLNGRTTTTSGKIAGRP